MNQYLSGIFSLAACLAVFATTAQSQTPAFGSSASDLFITDNIACGKINGKWMPGTLKKNTIFTPYKDTLAKLKLQIKAASPEKALKLENKNKKFKLLNKSGTKVCKSGPPSGSPTPVQTPSQTQSPGGSVTKIPTPGPTPRPTQTIARGCFNAQGDTTCFGIAGAGLVGNITRGKNIYEFGNGISTSCTGCHQESEVRNSDYSKVSNSFNKVTEMLTYRNDFSQQNYADLVAYLNRFN